MNGDTNTAPQPTLDASQTTIQRVAVAIETQMASDDNAPDDLARAAIQAMAHAQIAAPQLPMWSFQPDEDAPGVFLQCQTFAQRDAVMRLLGWSPEKAAQAKKNKVYHDL